MSLLTSKTPRTLENKLKLLGFELLDILLIFFYLSITNLLFGQTTLKLSLVYAGTIVLAITLYFAKRGRPENYLQDKIQSLINPSLFSANLPDTKHQPYFQRESYGFRKNKKSNST